jgi:hypothetical protein
MLGMMTPEQTGGSAMNECRLLAVFLLMILTIGCGSDDDPVGPGGNPGEDHMAPAAVIDLELVVFDEATVQVRWTAPGDDGSVGTAASYEIAYSCSPITPATWADCAKLASPPVPAVAGTEQTAEIAEPPTPDVYVAVKTVDDAGNWSSLSNLAHGHLEWTTWTLTSGLPHEVAAGLAIASDGTVWCSHPVEGGGGVSRFDGTQWTNYTTEDGLGSDLVLWFRGIAIADDGDVWVATYDRGASRFDGNTWTVYASENGLVDDLVAAVAIASNGDVWCAGPGMSRFDGSAWASWDTAEVGLPQYVFAVAGAPDGSVWAGGMGLRRFDGSTWLDYDRYHHYDRGPIHDIAFTADGDLWVVGDGISRFDGDQWTYFGFDDLGLFDISEAAVISVAEGVDGSIWAATSNQGVLRYDGTSWAHYSVLNGLADDGVFSVAVAPDGAVWFGTNGGVSRYSGD